MLEFCFRGFDNCPPTHTTSCLGVQQKVPIGQSMVSASKDVLPKTYHNSWVLTRITNKEIQLFKLKVTVNKDQKQLHRHSEKAYVVLNEMCWISWLYGNQLCKYRTFFMNDNKLDLLNRNLNFILLMKNLLLDKFDHIRGVDYTYRAESADELMSWSLRVLDSSRDEEILLECLIFARQTSLTRLTKSNNFWNSIPWEQKYDGGTKGWDKRSNEGNNSKEEKSEGLNI